LVIRRPLRRATRSFEKPRRGQPGHEEPAENQFRSAARHRLQILQQIARLLFPQIAGEAPELLGGSLCRLRQHVSFFALQLFRSCTHRAGVFLDLVGEAFLLPVNEAAPRFLRLPCSRFRPRFDLFHRGASLLLRRFLQLLYARLRRLRRLVDLRARA